MKRTKLGKNSNTPSLTRFFDLPNERLKHIAASEALPAIEAEGVFIQVHLQILCTDVVIDASNPVLRQTPEALDRVRVRIARNVYVRCVVDAAMTVAHPLNRIVDVGFIAEDHTLRHDSFAQMRKDRPALNVRDDASVNAPALFDSAPDCGLADCAARMRDALVFVFVVFLPAVKGLVGFDLAGELRAIAFIQHRANLVEYAPCALVGNAKFPLQLFRADTASRGSHQKDRVKPEFQGSGGILKNGAAHRMILMTAILAGISGAFSNAVMRSYLLAFWAADTVWIEPILKPLQAGRIVRKLLLKLHHRERAVGRTRSDRVVSIRLAHIQIYSRGVYLRQGDTYPVGGYSTEGVGPIGFNTY
jgi:hypothetical protein